MTLVFFHYIIVMIQGRKSKGMETVYFGDHLARKEEIMRIYMVRHGETDQNRKGCYYGKTDAVLTENGLRQAKQLKGLLRDVHFDRVISSPLVRAYHTAEIVMEGRNQEMICDSRLMEQDFGIFEGYTYPELQKQYPDELEEWNRNFTHYGIPGGESFLDVRRRVEDFLDDLAKNHLAKGKETVLLVAHKGTLGHLLAAMIGLPPEGYWNFVLEQGCYSMVDLEDGYAIFRKLNCGMGNGTEWR